MYSYMYVIVCVCLFQICQLTCVPVEQEEFMNLLISSINLYTYILSIVLVVHNGFIFDFNIVRIYYLIDWLH